MNINPQIKQSIDEMSVEEMLRRLRYAPAGDPMFLGPAGTYFHQVFQVKRASLPPGQYPVISKMVGWGK